MSPPAVLPGNVLVSVRPAATSNERLELVDPLAWADIRHAPEPARDVVMRRVAEGRAPANPSVLMWPKERGGYRQLTAFDPLDELIYRAMLHPVVAMLGKAVKSPGREVLSGVVEWRHNGWTLQPHRHSITERRIRSNSLLSQAGTEYLAVVDILNFFPSVPFDLLRSVLARSGVRDYVVDALIQFVRATNASTGLVGLPIGSHCSSVIGNTLLAPIDQFLRDSRVPFMRFMDDTWMFASDGFDSWQLVGAYASRARESGLALNDEKSEVLTGDPARRKVASRLIEYAHDAIDTGDSSVGDASWVTFEAARPDPRGQKAPLRWALGQLTDRSVPKAVRPILDDPEIIEAAPGHVVRYLEHMAGSAKRRSPEHSALMEFVVSEVAQPVAGDGDEVRRYIAARVAARCSLPPSVGAELLESVCSPGGAPPFVKAWQAKAWAKSQHFNKKQVLAAAEAVEDFSVRRVLIGALKGQSRVSRQLRGARELDLDLKPTIEWASA